MNTLISYNVKEVANERYNRDKNRLDKQAYFRLLIFLKDGFVDHCE